MESPKAENISFEETPLRTRFLKEFITEIILEIRRNLPEDELRKVVQEIKEVPATQTIPEPEPEPLPKFMPPAPQKISPAPIIKGQMQPFQQSHEMQEDYEPQLNEDPNQVDLSSLGEIRRYLMDPNTQVIECPGPNKLIIIRHNGLVQPIHHTLNEDQISTILNEVAQKTLIPILPGIYKAALGNLLITAVISEYVGTRFVIQKIPPGVQPSF